jgi:OOP family OmpA-OmpF porin
MIKSIPLLTFLILLCSELGFCQSAAIDSITYRRQLKTFHGKVLDKDTKAPVKANVVSKEVETGREIVSVNSDSLTGEFNIKIDALVKCKLLIGAKQYFFEEVVVDSLENDKNFYLIKIKKSTCGGSLPVIRFDAGSFRLSEDAIEVLSKFAEILSENKDLKMSIYGHTDAAGTASYNLKLSVKRANAARDYLISKGIEGERIRAKGFGEEKPDWRNDTEEGKSINRRVDFEFNNF